MKKPMFKKKSIYLLLFIIGTILPIYLLTDFGLETNWDFSLAQNLSFANQINSAWSSDVILSSISFFLFVSFEIRRLKMSWWLLLGLIPLDFILGLCSALPAFLFCREIFLAQDSLSSNLVTQSIIQTKTHKRGEST